MQSIAITDVSVELFNQEINQITLIHQIFYNGITVQQGQQQKQPF